jgi:homoserine kinase type II
MTDNNFFEVPVEEMKKYTPSSPRMLRQLELDSETTVATMTSIAETAREQYYYALIKDMVNEHYDLGKLVDVYQIFGGYVNVTFCINVEKDGERSTWIVRKYRSGKTIDALNFEHNLLLYAREHGSEYTAAPIHAKDGRSYVIETIDMGDVRENFLFAVFNYIDGLRLYSWLDNWAVDTVKDITIESAARSLAHFHSASYGFDPQGLRGDNLLGTNEDTAINDLIADLPRRLIEYRKLYTEAGLENKFVEYTDAFQESYTTWCKLATIPKDDYSRMFRCPCHLDFHGGNFMYSADESVAGSFDYDMAMIDSRLFDLALGLHYSLASWSLDKPGVIDLSKVELFISAYNNGCKEMGKIPSLTEIEQKYFFEAMLQAPIYVYGWAHGAVSTDMSANEFEYLYYCTHLSDCMRWLFDHEQDIRSLDIVTS